MEFATEYPPFFKSWNQFYNMVLKDEAQDEEEYIWSLEPVRKNNTTRLYRIENSPYRYKVRYIQQQALSELRARQFDWEQSNLLYLAIQEYADQYKDTVFYEDHFKPLINRLQQMAKK